MGHRMRWDAAKRRRNVEQINTHEPKLWDSSFVAQKSGPVRSWTREEIAALEKAGSERPSTTRQK